MPVYEVKVGWPSHTDGTGQPPGYSDIFTADSEEAAIERVRADIAQGGDEPELGLPMSDAKIIDVKLYVHQDDESLVETFLGL